MLYFGIILFGTVKLEHDTEKRIAIIKRLDSVRSTFGMSQEHIDSIIEAEQEDAYIDTDAFDGLVVCNVGSFYG